MDGWVEMGVPWGLSPSKVLQKMLGMSGEGAWSVQERELDPGWSSGNAARVRSWIELRWSSGVCF